ncbi:MAG TPA: hypothetical protein VF805_07590, partial [Anaeromyxobacteraceae bacterium]
MTALAQQDAPAGAGPATRRDALQGALQRLAAVAVLAHAFFVPISVAGMQIALGVAAGALVALRLTGRKVWARSGLDLPCLL